MTANRKDYGFNPEDLEAENSARSNEGQNNTTNANSVSDKE